MRRTGLIIVAIGFSLLAQAVQAQIIPIIPNPRLTWTSGESYSPAVAIDSLNNLHVVWYDDTPGNFEIYYKKSTDRGVTWSTSRRLTWTAGDSCEPDIAVTASGHLHVVWHEYSTGNSEIYYKKSTDGGVVWTTGKKLTWTSGWSYAPDIAVDPSDYLHVVWYDYAPGNYEIYYLRSADGGANWSTGERLTWTSGWSFVPDMAADAYGYLHVVWWDSTSGVYEIYYKRSTDGGANWSTSKRLTWSPGLSYRPDIELDSSGHPHVVWYDNTPGNDEIYYKRSTDWGASWTGTKRLTWTSGTSRDPDIEIDSFGYLNLIWDDDTPGNYDIYYKRSVDGGASWWGGIRFTKTAGESASSDMEMDSLGVIHFVWQDKTPGNFEIYYLAWQFMVPVSMFFFR